jgi:hypothetical protein
VRLEDTDEKWEMYIHKPITELHALSCVHVAALQTLQGSQASDSILKLLQPSSTRGASDTLRQRLRREKALAAVGAALPSTSQLLRHGHTAKAVERSSSDAAEESRQNCAPSTVAAVATADRHTCGIAIEGAVQQASHDSTSVSTSSHSDCSQSGQPQPPMRNLASAMPPVMVTFGQKQRVLEGTAPDPKSVAQSSSDEHLRSAVDKAKLLRAEMVAAGDVPGAVPCALPRHYQRMLAAVLLWFGLQLKKRPHEHESLWGKL